MGKAVPPPDFFPSDRRARMTEDKNLTPFSIADILKRSDGDGAAAASDGVECGGRRGVAAAAAGGPVRRGRDTAINGGGGGGGDDEALDMTSDKCVRKKGNASREYTDEKRGVTRVYVSRTRRKRI